MSLSTILGHSLEFTSVTRGLAKYIVSPADPEVFLYKGGWGLSDDFEEQFEYPVLAVHFLEGGGSLTRTQRSIKKMQIGENTVLLIVTSDKKPNSQESPLSLLQYEPFETSPQAGFERYRLFQSDQVTAQIVRIIPREYRARQHETLDTSLRILSGQGKVLLDSKRETYRIGSWFNVPKGTPWEFKPETVTYVLSVQHSPIYDKGVSKLRR